jgi:hypothetical protein
MLSGIFNNVYRIMALERHPFGGQMMTLRQILRRLVMRIELA